MFEGRVILKEKKNEFEYVLIIGEAKHLNS